MASFDLPYFGDAPYFEQYLGIWAIEESALQANVEFVKNLNLTLHLNSEQAAMARAGGRVEASVSDQVAVLSLTGSLMKQASSMGGGTSTADTRRAVRALARDPEIGAIVLRIDSPGGTVAGTEELAADIAAANQVKPVFAFIEDLGASAAYWLASQAGDISANATALVGSIGTYGVVQDVSGRAAQMGVKVHVVKAGSHKGAGVPGTEITAEHLSEMQSRVNALNAHFLSGVAKGRRMTAEQVQSLADGRVHIAAEAQKLGLIDRVSSLDETIARAQAAARKRKPMAASGSSSLSKGGHKMSDTTEGSVAELKPQAATPAQIKAECVGAPADFVLAQLEANATLEQAKSAWMVEMSKQLKAQQDQAAAMQAELEKAKSQPPAPQATGVEAIGSVSSADQSSSSIEQWQSIVAENRKAGMDPATAILVANKDNPGLLERAREEERAFQKANRRRR